jgi:predicted MFS family arabinose efflux permease
MGRSRFWRLVFLLVAIAAVIVLVLLIPSLGPESAMNRDLEECEAHATTGTYTITSFSTTEVSGVNSTETSIETTTQVQICTVSP